jgi:catalase (peroxidase I)
MVDNALVFPDNANLEKARRLLRHVEQRFGQSFPSE